MNYYPFHVGDYLTETVHLSWLEDCAYRRLLDLYYKSEQPIPLDMARAARLCRAQTKDERAAVETVLREFFTETDSGWAHSRCESEIGKAQDAARRAKENGRRGGRPPKSEPKDNPEKTQPVSGGNPEESNSQAPNPNPNPIYSVPNGTGAEAPTKTPEELTKDELWSAGKSLLTQAGMPAKQCGSFVGKMVKDYGDAVVIEAVRAAVVARPADPAEYLKAACQRHAGQRQPINRQEALEQRNRAVAADWVAEMQRGMTNAAE